MPAPSIPAVRCGFERLYPIVTTSRRPGNKGRGAGDGVAGAGGSGGSERAAEQLQQGIHILVARLEGADHDNTALLVAGNP